MPRAIGFPDTLVGQTVIHMLTLGVIAIGVGGLEAESVMLGRASYMRLPMLLASNLAESDNQALPLPTSCWRLPNSCEMKAWFLPILRFSAAAPRRYLSDEQRSLT